MSHQRIEPLRGTESPREYVERGGGGLRGEPGAHQHGPGDRTAKKQRKEAQMGGGYRGQEKVYQRGGEHEI